MKKLYKLSAIGLLLLFLLPIFSQAQTTGDYRSAASGNWDALATWERFNGVTWVTPSLAEGWPGQNANVNTVTVFAGYTVTLNVSVPLAGPNFINQVIISGAWIYLNAEWRTRT
jgi:hypothetical protein